jgi:hypothetical protein
MGGTGETVSYKRFRYGRKVRDEADRQRKKEELKKQINAIIDEVTTAITIVTLVETGDRRDQGGGGSGGGSGGQGGQSGGGGQSG